MLKTSSIFSFKIFSSALLWAVMAIICIEAFCRHALPLSAASHEVDRALNDVRLNSYDAEIVCLGDSVGRQVLLNTPIDGGNSFIFLGTNAAIEMPGQYYLTKRYLQSNKAPKAVVFIGLNPLGRNLQSRFTENFFQRCFLMLHEICEITLYRGIEFGLVMVFYKLFPAYRYRLYLQNLLLGFTNAKITSGPDDNGSAAGKYRYGFLNRLTSFGRYGKSAAISDIYFDKLVRTLYDKRINFYFICAPLPQLHPKARLNRLNNDLFMQYCEQLSAKYNNFYLFGNQEYYPDNLFQADGSHLNKDGLAQAVGMFKEKLVLIKEQN